MVHLQEVFDRLKRANLRLNPSKCSFGVEKVLYIGHVLSKDGIAVDQAKIQVVKSWPTPSTVKQL